MRRYSLTDELSILLDAFDCDQEYVGSTIRELRREGAVELALEQKWKVCSVRERSTPGANAIPIRRRHAPRSVAR